MEKQELVQKMADHQDQISQSVKTYAAASAGIGFGTLADFTGLFQFILVSLSIVAVLIRLYIDIGTLVRKKNGEET